VNLVKEKGKNVTLYRKYKPSKAMAERAAWELIKEKNPSLDLVTLLPSWIWDVRVLSLYVLLN
jgi:hypothetical protein